MNNVSVSEMKKWLYNVMETERRILVLNNVVSDIDLQLKQYSKNIKITKPEKHKIDFLGVICGAIGGAILGILVDAVFMIIALVIYTVGIRGILGIESNVIVPLGILVISAIILES